MPLLIHTPPLVPSPVNNNISTKDACSPANRDVVYFVCWPWPSGRRMYTEDKDELIITLFIQQAHHILAKDISISCEMPCH
jgi:hypothetical protein